MKSKIKLLINDYHNRLVELRTKKDVAKKLQHTVQVYAIDIEIDLIEKVISELSEL